MKKNFLTALTCVMFVASMSAAFAYKQEDVNKLLSTGKCESGDISGYQFTDKEKATLGEFSKPGERIDLIDANLTDVNLKNANLEGAFLFNANLDRAVLDGANLTEARLYETSLYSTTLQCANLNRTSFRYAYGDNVNFSGSNWEKAEELNKNCFPNSKW